MMLEPLSYSSRTGAFLWEVDANYGRNGSLFLIVFSPILLFLIWYQSHWISGDPRLYYVVPAVTFIIGLRDVVNFERVHYSISNEIISVKQSLGFIKKTKQIRIESLEEILITKHGDRLLLSTNTGYEIIFALKKQDVIKAKQIVENLRAIIKTSKPNLSRPTTP
jgi:hypothetical protein